ncbi:MAG: hypothetical protein JKY23_04265 [Nitrospinaceae bacterium]|nr:hypothetical protein [Nitrospinaceae bacterium]
MSAEFGGYEQGPADDLVSDQEDHPPPRRARRKPPVGVFAGLEDEKKKAGRSVFAHDPPVQKLNTTSVFTQRQNKPKPRVSGKPKTNAAEMVVPGRSALNKMQPMWTGKDGELYYQPKEEDRVRTQKFAAQEGLGAVFFWVALDESQHTRFKSMPAPSLSQGVDDVTVLYQSVQNRAGINVLSKTAAGRRVQYQVRHRDVSGFVVFNSWETFTWQELDMDGR